MSSLATPGPWSRTATSACRPDALDRHLDRPRAGRVLDGVREEVQEHLLEAARVGPNEDRPRGGRRAGSAAPSAAPGRPRRPTGRPPPGRPTSSSSSSWPRLDPADVEEPLDERGQPPRLGQRPSGVRRRLLDVAIGQVPVDELEVVVDRGRRRLELVAGRGHQPLEAESHRPLRDVPDRDDAAPGPVLARERLGHGLEPAPGCRPGR